ncbi:hypothetical protein E2C01_002448 [Portunus trituberculatus]|uniref:Uncharacterized protein n=1 Tax=Portunus trituberculatus TaxID=210409 RepID=A0A5B7CKE7_PORTR|nr:hypothetical protein [Portunus trituberculatus]
MCVNEGCEEKEEEEEEEEEEGGEERVHGGDLAAIFENIRRLLHRVFEERRTARVDGHDTHNACYRSADGGAEIVRQSSGPHLP